MHRTPSNRSSLWRICFTTESRYGLAPAAIYPINQKFPSYEEKRTAYYESRWRYFRPDGYQDCSLLFPILTSGDTDTTSGGGGGDTLAVEGPELLRRMVSVSPNPASKEARCWTARLKALHPQSTSQPGPAAPICSASTPRWGLSGAGWWCGRTWLGSLRLVAYSTSMSTVRRSRRAS